MEAPTYNQISVHSKIQTSNFSQHNKILILLYLGKYIKKLILYALENYYVVLAQQSTNENISETQITDIV